jgi:hypothetical protein
MPGKASKPAKSLAAKILTPAFKNKAIFKDLQPE